MKIQFRTKKLCKQCSDDRQLRKAFGAQRAKLLRRRLDDIDAATNLAEMTLLPGRLHSLTGDRSGQFSLDLDGPYRLFFEPVLSGSEADEGVLDLERVTVVRILEIGDPHG